MELLGDVVAWFADPASWQGEDGMVHRTWEHVTMCVLALLTVAIGIPFLVISTTATLLQRWFVYTGHPSSRDPYFLYAASNLGSLISLLGYPLVIEEKVVGVFAMCAGRPISQDTFEALAPVARTIAIGIERTRAAAQRERLVEELERTVHFNEMFAGILGHDLRNPLGAIVAAANLLLLHSDDSKSFAWIRRILGSSDRMKRMVDQLLDFTRVRIGGGVTTVRAFLEADLIDHLHIVLVPILLGRGERLWDSLEGLEQRFAIEATPSPSGVVHLILTRRAR